MSAIKKYQNKNVWQHADQYCIKQAMFLTTAAYLVFQNKNMICMQSKSTEKYFQSNFKLHKCKDLKNSMKKSEKKWKKLF